MSKIICDVCGTSYPETATQCPICGCVRPVDVTTVNDNRNTTEGEASGTYTYVKGGRFSKANVKKRNSENYTVPEEPVFPEEEVTEEKGKSDRGLTIAICVLLLAIIAVVIYIALHFFLPGQSGKDPNLNGDSTTESTQNSTTESTVLDVPCVGITVSKADIELDKVGAAHLLNVTAEPSNTTDVIVFRSSNEAVATVTAGGKIVAVGAGEAVITISCGEKTTQCRVVCTFADPTEPTEEPTLPADDFKLNRTDFTLSKKGDIWKLYSGEVPAKDITWTSDNEKVATIKDGVVTAVGSGTTMVHGEYNGKKLSCTVRCAPTVGKYVEPEEETKPAVADYTVSHTDVTIEVDGSFRLELLDINRSPVAVAWTVADESICSVSDSKVTGLAVGRTKVYVTYEGAEYSCTVRVKAKES